MIFTIIINIFGNINQDMIINLFTYIKLCPLMNNYSIIMLLFLISIFTSHLYLLISSQKFKNMMMQKKILYF